MTICKHSLLRVLGIAAVASILAPEPVLAEFGICPPYEKRFNQSDPDEEIEAFLAEINFRPGGGTLLLEPGDCTDGECGAYYGIEIPPVTGTICIKRAPVEGEGRPWAEGSVTVEQGGTLTLISVGPPEYEGWAGWSAPDGGPLWTVNVAPGATFFADDARIPVVENHGSAYVQVSRAGSVTNAVGAVLSWRGGRIGGPAAAPGLENRGWALVDRAALFSTLDCGDPKECAPSFTGPAIDNSGVLTVFGSTVTMGCDFRAYFGDSGCNDDDFVISRPGSTLYIISSSILGENSIVNEGGTVEIGRSIVAGNCAGTSIADAGFNVFGSPNCSITASSSVHANPRVRSDQGYFGGGFAGPDPEPLAELGAGSPAIDLVPLDLCKPTDRLGRNRIDGNGDGFVDCDAGAMEYTGHDIMVRTDPWWLEVGTLDLATESALVVKVFSNENFDATTIDFSTIDIVGLESRALRGPVLRDLGNDGLTDYVFRYKLSRMPPLECGSYDQLFTAQTTEGLEVGGQLRFEVTGCSP